MRMTVDRSIPNRSAASLWLSSPVASCSHSSYFSVGLRNRLARRPRRSRRGSCWAISTLLLGAGGPYTLRQGSETRARPAPSERKGLGEAHGVVSTEPPGVRQEGKAPAAALDQRT